MDMRKKKIAIALFVAMFLAAFEGTVVATAVATIVKDLQGFEFVSWVFSLYLLTAAISTPIYGKFADLYGRKSVLSLGIVIFILGSLFCGLSQNMFHLIISRALQGLGAGSILTVTFTIIGDVFTLKERALVQGGISTVWGIAGLFGPLIGGFLIDTWSWHWIFLINVPFGLLCLFLLRANLTDIPASGKPTIDYAGTIALSLAIGAFLYGIMAGYANGTLAASLFVTLACLAAFYFIEKRATDPIVPFSILTKASAVINSICFSVSMVLIAVTVYMPLYLQTIGGHSATIAGLAMGSMSFSWLACSVILAHAMNAYGSRSVVIAGSLILILSSYLISTLTITSSLFIVSFYAFIFGFSFSGTLNTLTFMVQDSVGYTQRGAAVGLNALTRTLAQAVGVGLFGSVINSKLAAHFLEKGRVIDINNLYDPQYALTATELQEAFYSALHFVFILLIAFSVLALLIAYFLPRHNTHEKKLREVPPAEQIAYSSSK